MTSAAESARPEARPTETASPDLDVVIVNWNTGHHLSAAVSSLDRASRAGIGELSILVVDNASTDDSLDRAEGSATSAKVTVIRNDANRGFAAACNQAARAGSGDYLLFLNPDVRVDPDSLARAVAFMEESVDDRIGICGVRLEAEDGVPAPSAGRSPSLGIQFLEMTGLSKLAPGVFKPQIMRPEELTRDMPVPHVCGAFYLIRRSLFDRLGGFDERFFVYCEEVDLAERAAEAGWASYYLNDVRACHVGEQSSDQVKDRRLFYLLRSRTQFIDKHSSGRAAWMHAFLTATVEFVTRLAASLVGVGPLTPRQNLRAYRSYYRYLLSRRANA
jgi:N-acetylglucosaminyl-diphospho-decaprenol L-rhamnosyltransferase